MRAATLFTVLVTAACGFEDGVEVDTSTADRDERIVGGYESVPGSRAYQVSLQDPSYGHFCGGALISSEWVLTAAHCVDGNNSGLRVRVGAHQLSSNAGQLINVSQVISHPGYSSSTMENDVALLELAAPADPSYTPLLLPSAAVMSATAAPGDMVVVSGWGTTREGTSNLPDALQEVALPVVANSTCNSAYGGDIYDSMLCAGYASGGKDSCQGDSGGPMAAEYQGNVYSIGVVSWGEGCARPGKYGVYTRTQSFVSWIEGNVGGGGGGGGGGSDEIVELDNGFPASGLGSAKGTWLRFAVEVPASATNLVIQSAGGSGDADLYVRSGAEPTLSAYDCRPYKSGNNESCTIASPNAGTYYAYLYGYSAFSGVSLSASYATEGGGGGGSDELTLLDSGVAVNGLAGDPGSWLRFAIDVAAGVPSVSLSMSGGSGDADLYARVGAEPTESAYDCRPYEGGNNESCVLDNPAAGRLYVFVRGYTAFADVALRADVAGGGGGGDPLLSSGATVTGLAATTGNWLYYRVNVPAGTASLRVEISGGTGDADLHTRAGERPTDATFSCRPYKDGNNEVCTLANPSPGTHYIGLRAYQTFNGVVLSTTY